MDTEINIKEDSVKSESSTDVSQTTVTAYHIDLTRSKQDKDEITMTCSESDSLSQELTFKDEPEYINVEMKPSILEEVTVKNEILDGDTLENNKQSTNSNMQTHAREKRFECRICKKKFLHRGSHWRHMKNHTGVEPSISEQKLSNTSISHQMNTNAGVKLVKCDICKTTLSAKKHLKEHMRIHTGEKPFACFVCKIQFRVRQHMMRHLRTHTGEKPYECNICHKRFASNYTLQDHMNLHTGEEPFECDICKKKFSMRNSRLNHIKRNHAGEKLVQCEDATTATQFSSLYNTEDDQSIVALSLKEPYQCETSKNENEAEICFEPIRTHSREKRHACVICSRRFSRRYMLTNHMNTHTNEQPFQCDICKKKFKAKRYLLYHKEIIHSGEKSVELRESGSNNDKIAENETETEISLEHTGEKPYACDICSRRFSRKYVLKNHMNTHTSEQPFECDICKKKFKTKRYLLNHTKSIHSGETFVQLKESDSKNEKMDKPIIEEVYVTTELPLNAAEVASEHHAVLIDIKQEPLDIEPQPEGEDESTTMVMESDPLCEELTFKDEPEFINNEVTSLVKEEVIIKNEIIDVGDTLGKCNFPPKGTVQIHKDEKHFKCSICKYQCLRRQHLLQHMRKHTGEKPFECTLCKKKFVDKNSVRRHMRIHMGVKPFECEICKKTFTDSSSIRPHMRTHTEEKPYGCNVCTKTFSTKFKLQSHMNTHTSEKLFDCYICKKKFLTKRYLSYHMSRLHAELQPEGKKNPPKSFECSICRMKFPRKSKLERHMGTHSAVKPFECGLCKKRFADRNNIPRHMQTHTGVKPFECSICRMKFLEKSKLRRHMGTHSEVKPFECGICKKRFADRSNIPRHMQTHTGAKPFECKICKKKYADKSSLRLHIRTHTGEKLLECTICKVKRTTQSKLREHMKTHAVEKPYTCDICKKKFLKRRYLLHHLKSFHTVDNSSQLTKPDRNEVEMDAPIEGEVSGKSEISNDPADNVSDGQTIFIDIKQEPLDAERN